MTLLAALAASRRSSGPAADPMDRWRDAITARTESPATFVAAGDSLTDESSLTIDGQGWTPRLARKMLAHYGAPVTFHDTGALGTVGTWDPAPALVPGIHIVDAAISGRLTTNYIDNVGALPNLVAARPDVVAHMVGMNDYGVSARTPVQVADKIAESAGLVDSGLIAAGFAAPVHLILVQPRRLSAVDGRDPAWWDEYGVELARIVAADPDMVLVDMDAAVGLDPATRRADGFHLSEAGWEIVATTTAALLVTP